MKFTVPFLIRSSLLLGGVLGCENCPAEEQSHSKQVGPKGSSGAENQYYAQPIYAIGDNNPDPYGYNYEPEYILGAADEDEFGMTSGSGSSFPHPGSWNPHREYPEGSNIVPSGEVDGILRTRIPYSTNPGLSSLEARLLPTSDAAFYSGLARFTATDSGSLPSVTMALVAQASDSSIGGFSSVLESAVGKVTSATAVATATADASATRSSISAGSATDGPVIATGVPQAEKKEEGEAGNNSSAVGVAKESAAAAATGNSKVAAWVMAAAAAMGVSLFMTLY